MLNKFCLQFFYLFSPCPPFSFISVAIPVFMNLNYFCNRNRFVFIKIHCRWASGLFYMSSCIVSSFESLVLLPCVYVSSIYCYFGDLHQHIVWENQNKQERQTTYNLTLKRAFANIVAVEKQKVLHVLREGFSLRYPACNARAPFCHV
jgi:hypothetical protein